MNAIKQPGQYAFTGNPVLFILETNDNSLVTVTVSVANRTMAFTAYPYFVSPGVFHIEFDIQDILKSFVGDVFTGDEIISTGELQSYSLQCVDYFFSGFALQGGTSKTMQRILSKNNLDIFTYRFLNPLNQFLFTTRSNQKVIKMRRNELRELYFLNPLNETIELVSDTGGSKTLSAYEIGVPVHIDMIRFFQNYFPNPDSIKELQIKVNGVIACTINISDSLLEERYLLQFRNSLNVFEYLELKGKAKYTPEFTADNTYNKYNSDINDLEKSRRRETATTIIEAETGFRPTLDLQFINDLLTSDEIYLQENGEWLPCLVTASPGYAKRQTIPESILLNIEMVDAGSLQSPIDGDFEIYPPTVLTDNYGEILTDNDGNVLTSN
ncbi:hypothetical protein D0T49_03895 [Paludibacter sp. 221]|uniref:hypothetical protein n=1 Tax=Paludibacter sp. 221 TaxID=2302939 RepID=UPI0013D2344B|nr:hypothetical protein [Paludibacter sp. 221]NDV46183.1 hypothetical protein [Paludibacter sp. 221]